VELTRIKHPDTKWAAVFCGRQKRKSNGERNAFYEIMHEVAPGDVVFSFRDTMIAGIGISLSYCYESLEP
jgi:hypothetical protein